jgi:hypothetical protein
MGTNRRGELPARLEEVRRRLERWRRTHAARSRISEPLWASVVKMAEKYGVHRTAKALRLDYYSVKKRVEQQAVDADASLPEGGAAAFVELASATRGGSCECTVEFEDSSGAKMQVYFKGVETPDLASLSRSFWNPAS